MEVDFSDDAIIDHTGEESSEKNNHRRNQNLSLSKENVERKRERKEEGIGILNDEKETD